MKKLLAVLTAFIFLNNYVKSEEETTIIMPLFTTLSSENIVLSGKVLPEIHAETNEYILSSSIFYNTYNITSYIQSINENEHLNYTICNGTIYIKNVKPNEKIIIYDTFGRQMQPNAIISDYSAITLNTNGIYIIRISNKVYKILIK